MRSRPLARFVATLATRPTDAAQHATEPRHRRRRSSVRLAFFEKQFHNVDVRLQRLGRGDLVRPEGARRWLTDPQRSPISNRHDLGDRRIAIEDGDCFPASDGAQVLTQSRLQFRDPYGFHGHIMTINSHDSKCAVMSGHYPFRSALVHSANIAIW